MAPVDIQRVWLTEDAYNRMKVELANLLVERFGYGVENGDPEAGERPNRDMDDGAAMANWQHRELRIRQLKELIRSAVVLEPPDDGVAEPGMVLTVHYDGNDSTETFPMVDRQEAAQAGLEVWTPAGAWNPAHRLDSRTTTVPTDAWPGSADRRRSSSTRTARAASRSGAHFTSHARSVTLY